MADASLWELKGHLFASLGGFEDNDHWCPRSDVAGGQDEAAFGFSVSGKLGVLCNPRFPHLEYFGEFSAPRQSAGHQQLPHQLRLEQETKASINVLWLIGGLAQWISTTRLLISLFSF